MNNPLIIIVDSDGIVAQSNLTDENHDLAVKISEKLCLLNYLPLELESKSTYILLFPDPTSP